MIFGIDQSITGTGVSCVDNEGKFVKAIRIDSGPVREKDGATRRMPRLHYIVSQILGFIEENAGDKHFAIAREDYSYASKGQVFQLGELGGVIDMAIYLQVSSQCIGYYTLPIGTWKKFALGRGDTGKDTSYLLTVFKAFGIEFKDDNVADSFMIAYTLWAMYKSKNDLSFFENITQEAKVALLQKASGMTIANIKKATHEQYGKGLDAVFMRCLVFEAQQRESWMNDKSRGKITIYPEPTEANA